MNYQPESAPHHGAVQIAVTWLASLHRKGWNNASMNLLQQLASQSEFNKLMTLDDQVLECISININEWLLAEGDINARGGVRRIHDYVLSPSGPRLNLAQRDWLQQLGQRPLRLYDVTDVVRGVQMTVCDALDKQAEPMVVRERSGTQNLQPGNLLGCRVVRAGDHFEMSGAAYLFSLLSANQVLSLAREQQQMFGEQLDGPRKMGLVILRQWLEQFLQPAPLPMLIDHYSGEPMKSITDHYRVTDEAALAQALASQSDVEGDRQEGWSRTMDCTDGQVRASVHLNSGKEANHIKLAYRTQTYADEGRVWFEALVGASASFLRRDIQDPADVMAQPPKPVAAALPPQVDPQTMTLLMTQVLHSTYANWADEPIPMLDHKTPKQAITTSAGLERVKGLLRSYEARESELARQDGRAEVSYDFLWASIGLTR